MPLLGALFCFFLFWLINRGQKKTIENRGDAYFQNQKNGWIEYLLSRYIFFEEVVPEIYERYNRIQAPGSGPIGIYDQEFERLGNILYLKDPANEALVRARKVTRESMKLYAYTSLWIWNERNRQVNDETWKNMNRKPEEKHYMFFRRPDIKYDDSIYDFPHVEISYKDVVISELPKEDLRRITFMLSDGETRCWLHDTNTSSKTKINKPYSKQYTQIQYHQ